MKKISELSEQELYTLIESNHALGDMVYSDMIDTEMYYISEQLDYIRDGLNNWQIGEYTHCFIHVGDAMKFLDGLEKLQKSFGTLPDQMTAQLERVLAARDRFRALDMSYRNTYMLSNFLDVQAQYFADHIAQYFESCLDLDHLSMVSYFVEFYAEERMDNSYWIDENGHLFQTTTREIK